MIHIRIDEGRPNSERKFACGMGPTLPAGDTWLYPGAVADFKADCPGCNPTPTQLGTPLSALSGRDGGNDEWRRISESWGYP